MSIRKLIHSGLAAIGLICGLGMATASASVSVTVQPQNPVVLVGSNLTFSALTTVTGGETITGYAWHVSSNNLPPYLAISGATNATFTLTNIQTTDAGYYFVSVTYNSGPNIGLTAVSTVSQLSIRDQPRLTSQPASLVRGSGSNATFSVTAQGSQPLFFAWRDGGVKLIEGGRISGSGSNSVTITGLVVSDSGNYDVVVSNSFGAVTSQVATLKVYDPPSVINPPQSLTILTGSNAVFTVTPGGTPPLSFQWKKDGITLFNSGRVSGATSNVLTITGALTNDDGNYSVSFSNPVGAITSAVATLTVLIPPAITSPTNALGQQGLPFNYTIIATGTLPIQFGADGLPDGLSITSSNGVIAGTPSVSGVFEITLYATNAAATAATNLELTLVTDVPGITSPLAFNGQEGQSLSYTITASNNPVSFTVSGLPPGVNFDPISAVISGPALVSGAFPIIITAFNQYGADTEVLVLTLASAVPMITSPLVATGTENATNFSYVITATNSPTSFGAIGLPAGLAVDPVTGIISGTTFYGGTNNVVIWAANAYGVGSNTLSLAVAYETLTGLAITDVTSTYSAPYLLDFTFTLRDDPNAATDPSLGNAVVRPPEQLQVLCLEGDLENQIGVPIGSETAFIVNQAVSAVSAKLLKTFFVLDYTFSMFNTPGAIDDMQSSVETLIDQEPASAQFGVYEFSADYLAPQLVTGFTSDKVRLAQDIDGIRTNFVKGNYAGTRFYDAMAAALFKFPATNVGELHYVIVMSDGYDDSSILTTNANSPTLPDVIVNAATNKSVKIYCVGFGPNPNTNVLQYIASGTGGRYYSAATPGDLAGQFALLLKDLNSQYLLRWATLQRAAVPFQPMFQVTVGGVTAGFNTNIIVYTITNIVTNAMPPDTTNIIVTNITSVPDFNPPDWAGNVQTGALTLAADSDTNVSSVTLRAFYVPRFVREIRVHYRPNYPCTPNLLSATDPADFLYGWSMTQTNDATNGLWLTLASPDPTNVLTSLPYGIMGQLVNFQFQDQALPNSQTAFSYFTVDNTIYSNLPPSGQTFTLTNSTAFVTNYPPTPPHGTPVPWLVAHGFALTNDFAAVELSDPNGNGFAVWQDYIAGLDPTNAASRFVVAPIGAPQPGQPPVITFNSELGRIYRVDWAAALGDWLPLLANINGTGGEISVPDNRDLSGVGGLFYRVVVSYP